MFAFLTPLSAHAHPGHGLPGLLHGFFHPITGLDHLTAALAVGILAVHAGKKFIYLPIAFLGGLLIGGLAGFSGHPLPFQEAGIVFSVGLLGLSLLAPAAALPSKVLYGLVALFGAFHGSAHGSELSPGASALLFSIGFVSSTFLLHLAGAASVVAAKRYERALSAGIRVAGTALVAVSIAMWFNVA
jgi:urease accessory protein